MSEVLWWSCLRVCVRLSVCLTVSASISPEQHVQSLPVLRMLLTTVTRFSSGSVAKRYVHLYPVLWMTSCLNILASNRQRRKMAYSQSVSKGDTINADCFVVQRHHLGGPTKFVKWFFALLQRLKMAEQLWNIEISFWSLNRLKCTKTTFSRGSTWTPQRSSDPP